MFDNFVGLAMKGLSKMVNWASYVAVAQNISCNMIFIQSTMKWHLAAARKWAIQSRIFNFDSMYNNTYLSEIESF